MAAEQIQANPKTNSGSFVSVGCKLPNGLHLRTFRKEEQYENVLGGGTRKVDLHVPTGDHFVVYGNSVPHMQAPQGYLIVGDYGITPNVPKEFWDMWFEQNKNSEVVRNNLIFSSNNDNSAFSRAREQAAVRTGFERLNPDALPPEFVKGVVTIKTADTKTTSA